MKPMPRHRAIVISRPGVDEVYYWCPGCKDVHCVPFVYGSDKLPRRWLFDGNLDYPTLSPSVKHLQESGDSRCHYHVQSGWIRFCGDCAVHKLGGQNFELLTLPQWPLSSLAMLVPEFAKELAQGSKQE